MKPLASPTLARPFVETPKPAVARNWPLRPEVAASPRPQRAEPRVDNGQTDAAKRHLNQLAAHLRILQTGGAANPAMAAMLAYEMQAALGAYAAAGAVAPPVVGLDGLRGRLEAHLSPRRVSVVV